MSRFSIVCGAVVFVAALSSACRPMIVCAPHPEDAHGICDPNQPVCGGGSSDPVDDPRMDGAVDITTFPAGQIPTGVVLSVPNEGRLHVLTEAELVYAVNPPASGPHFDIPAATGFYCDALSPGNWVHSMEHGYVVILFDESKAGDCNLRQDLFELLSSVPVSPTFGTVKLVITPQANLPHAIGVVAWNRQLFLPGMNAAAITEFYTKYIDMGPELVP